jgi:hypothetical protein
MSDKRWTRCRCSPESQLLLRDDDLDPVCSSRGPPSSEPSTFVFGAIGLLFPQPGGAHIDRVQADIGDQPIRDCRGAALLQLYRSAS